MGGIYPIVWESVYVSSFGNCSWYAPFSVSTEIHSPSHTLCCSRFGYLALTLQVKTTPTSYTGATPTCWFLAWSVSLCAWCLRAGTLE